MKTKRIISLLASLAMMVTAVTGAMTVSVVSAADDFPTSGKCGATATWLINTDGVLVISGTGEMSAYADNQSIDWSWGKLKSGINEIVVEDGITVGGKSGIAAFHNEWCPYVSKITLPPSLTKLNGCISPDAGAYVNLKDIYVYSKDISDASTINNTMNNRWSKVDTVWHVYKDSTTETSLRENLLLNDNQIEYISDNEEMPTISNKTPAKLEPVGETSGPAGLSSKYEWNETSKTLEFSGKGVISIADYYKQYAEETEHIIIESGITRIFAPTGELINENRSGAFYGFTALKDVKLPETLVEIEESTFYGDSSLTNINFPESLEKIGLLAFGDTNLEGDILFPDNLNTIGEQAFANTKIKSINLHEGMTIIGQAFTGCNSLKDVKIPNNVYFRNSFINGAGMQRPPATFSNCTELETVTIENGCAIYDAFGHKIYENGIVESLFSECTSLKTVIMRGNFDFMHQKVFFRCTSLTDIYLYNTNLTTITAKNQRLSSSDVDSDNYADSFNTTNNPTFHVVKGSQTEKTLKEAGYLTKENTVYIADTTALETAIADAETIETDKYTDETVSEFTKAIENAKALLDNMNATQDEVDKAVQAIEDAKTALVEKSDEPSSSDPSDSSDPSNSSGNNNQSQSPNTPATPSTSAPTTATPKPVTPPAVTTTVTKPAKVKNVKVTAKKKKLNVSWKKVSGATGYEVLSATNNKFTKNKKTVTVKKNKVTLKKLKPKKKYFVKVRAYKLANGRKYFGKWSKVVKKNVK